MLFRSGGRHSLQEAGGSGDDGGGYDCLLAVGVEDAGRIILFRLFLSCRNVEASLLQLVLDVAFIGFPQVTEHFRKNQF